MSVQDIGKSVSFSPVVKQESLVDWSKKGLQETITPLNVRKIINNELTRAIYEIELRQQLKIQGVHNKKILDEAVDFLLGKFDKDHPPATNSIYYRKLFDASYDSNSLVDNSQALDKQKALIRIIKIQLALAECVSAINQITKDRGIVWWARNQKENLSKVVNMINKANLELEKAFAKGAILDERIPGRNLVQFLNDQLQLVTDKFPNNELHEFNSQVSKIECSDNKIKSALLKFYSSSHNLAELLNENLDLEKVEDAPLNWVDTQALHHDFNQINQDNLKAQNLFVKVREDLIKVSDIVSEIRLETLSLKQTNKKQEESINELSIKNESLKEELDKAKDQLLDLQELLKAKNSQEDEFLDLLITKLEEKVSKIDEEKENIDKVTKAITSLSKKLKKNIGEDENQKNEHLNSVVEVMGKASKLLANYRTTLDFIVELSDIVKNYDQKRNPQNNKITQKVEQITSTIKSSRAKADDFDLVIRNLQDQLELYKEFTRTLKEKLSSLEMKFADLEIRNKELEAKLAKSERNVVKAKKNQQIKDTKEIESLRSELEANKKSLEELQKPHDNFKSQVKNLELNISEKDREIDDLKNQIKKKKKDIESLNQKIEEGKGDVEPLKKEKLQIEEKLSVLQEQASIKENDLNKEIKDLKDNHEKELVDLQGKYDSAVGKLKEHKKLKVEKSRKRYLDHTKSNAAVNEYEKSSSTSRSRLNTILRSAKTKDLKDEGNSIGAYLVFILRDGKRRWTSWGADSLANKLINKLMKNDARPTVYDRDNRKTICADILRKNLGITEENKGNYQNLSNQLNAWVNEVHDMVTAYSHSGTDFQKATQLLNGLMTSRIVECDEEIFSIRDAVKLGVQEDIILNALRTFTENQIINPFDGKLQENKHCSDNLLFLSFSKNEGRNSGVKISLIK